MNSPPTPVRENRLAEAGCNPKSAAWVSSEDVICNVPTNGVTFLREVRNMKFVGVMRKNSNTPFQSRERYGS
jgi:hypothetical protein